ncbi:hypothetical protein CDAR_480361 [Caerostris darwini]|uniref:Uncharacterized protein n=1 Tax=Caerostris darwini TaxID=1538125 RepID=A0AAV4V0P5_9ARAC|nr:hypothetical protein CDAR_480361 [Caerostris darwini]
MPGRLLPSPASAGLIQSTGQSAFVFPRFNDVYPSVVVRPTLIREIMRPNNCSFQQAALWASPFFGLCPLIKTSAIRASAIQNRRKSPNPDPKQITHNEAPQHNTSSSAQALIKSAAERPKWVSPFAGGHLRREGLYPLRDPGRMPGRSLPTIQALAIQRRRNLLIPIQKQITQNEALPTTSSSEQALIKSAAEWPEWVSPLAGGHRERGAVPSAGRDPGLQIEFAGAAPAKSSLSWANLISGAECFCVSSF